MDACVCVVSCVFHSAAVFEQRLNVSNVELISELKFEGECMLPPWWGGDDGDDGSASRATAACNAGDHSCAPSAGPQTWGCQQQQLPGRIECTTSRRCAGRRQAGGQRQSRGIRRSLPLDSTAPNTGGAPRGERNIVQQQGCLAYPPLSGGADNPGVEAAALAQI